jgi:N-ethylmaleimide reductase
VRLSPLGKLNDISDENPEATFGYIAERLNDYEFAYLHIVNPALEQMQNGQEPDPRALNMVKMIRGKSWPAASSLTPRRSGFGKALRT